MFLNLLKTFSDLKVYPCFCIRNEGYGYKNVDCLYPNRLVHKYIYARIEIKPTYIVQ